MQIYVHNITTTTSIVTSHPGVSVKQPIQPQKWCKFKLLVQIYANLCTDYTALLDLSKINSLPKKSLSVYKREKKQVHSASKSNKRNTNVEFFK
jgi:hypothetical protein